MQFKDMTINEMIHHTETLPEEDPLRIFAWAVEKRLNDLETYCKEMETELNDWEAEVEDLEGFTDTLNGRLLEISQKVDSILATDDNEDIFEALEAIQNIINR